MFFQKKSCDWMIVGLGNPGPQYEMTRHNAGFLAMDRLAQALGVKVSRAKFKALTALVTVEGQRVLLLMPQTFMNNSGEVVGQAARFYQIPPERIVVVFDDISLPVGRIRVRAEGSAGGHNGLKSIIAHLNSQAFPRVKVGVGEKPHPDYDLAAWVLSRFTPQEKTKLDPALDNAAQAAVTLLSKGFQAAASQFNGKG